MRAFIAGYYGFDNTGDEAVLAVMLADLRALEPGLSAVVVTNDARATAALGVDTVHWADIPAIVAAAEGADLVILGGGGIFHDYWRFDPESLLTRQHHGIAYFAGFPVLAALLRKPCALYAVGVGPLTTDDGRSGTRMAFEQAQVITVRDAHSKTLLESLGLDGERIRVTADPAFRLPRATDDRATEILVGAGLDVRARPRLGLALRQWDVGVDPERWENEVARATDEFLQRHDAVAVFVPFQRFEGHALVNDVTLAERVRTRMRRASRAVVLDASQAPAEKAALLASCDLVLGMRLHSLIFAVAAGVPAVALAYDAKVRALMEDVGASGQLLSMEDMTANALGDLLARTYARRTELQTTFTAAGRRLSDRASETARLVLAAAREWSPVGGAAAAFAGRIALDQTRKLAAAQATLAELWPQVATLHEVVRNRDEQIAALRREVQAVSERLGRTSEQTAAADARLGAIYASRGWALLQWLQAVRLKLAPRGSFRERLLHASLRRRPRVEREGPAMRR